MSGGRLSVRGLQLDEVNIRIKYFHEASDEHLRTLGVDRRRLPPPEAWLAWYESDYARPIEERENYALRWELDGMLVGFSSIDRIAFGREGFMHLHILDPNQRKAGLGADFVRMSARVYFDVFRIAQLFSEPNAFNVAPNRTLQRAGFRYLYTHETVPGPLNFYQPVTRWVLPRTALPDSDGRHYL